MNAINKVLNQTESGEFTPPKARKRNRLNKRLALNESLLTRKRDDSLC